MAKLLGAAVGSLLSRRLKANGPVKKKTADIPGPAGQLGMPVPEGDAVEPIGSAARRRAVRKKLGVQSPSVRRRRLRKRRRMGRR